MSRPAATPPRSPLASPLSPGHDATSSPREYPLAERLFAIAVGCLMSLAISGYQVGKSNHTVYLLDGIRRSDPELLARDWFTNHTLQYHGLFSIVTRQSMEWGVFGPVFLVGYLLTVVFFHWGCWRVVRALGGSPAAYVLSVVLLHLSAGGTGLGAFQFLQDGAFLPSNVANVALLWGIAMFMEGRVWPAALWLGAAGVCHINHAVFAPPLFVAGVLAQYPSVAELRKRWRTIVAAGAVVAALVAINVVPAMLHLRQDSGGERLPFAEFVQIYAKLRHPHHYYPPAWHPALYLASLWTLIPAAYFLLKGRDRLPPLALRVVCATAGFLIAATLVALTFAGLIFVSERLIQLAVFRFSILYIYLGCALTAWGLLDSGLVGRGAGRAVVVGLLLLMGAGFGVATAGLAGETVAEFARSRWAPLAVTTGLVAVLAVYVAARDRRTAGPAYLGGAAAVLVATIALWRGGALGLNYIPEDSADYIRLAHWARDHTPKDAMFVVPPDEQCWRVESQRSVLINFKAIPQTAGEMPEWKRRMQAVTGVDDLPSLAGNFTSTLRRLHEVYSARSEADLRDVAARYGCRYIVTTTEYPTLNRVGPDPASPDGGTGPYRMYDLGPAATPTDATRPAR